MAEQESARADRARTGEWPAGSHYRQWEVGSLSDYAALALGVEGPAYTIATACSASAKVFASGRRLIEAGVCDAVVVGGADTLCRMTVVGLFLAGSHVGQACAIRSAATATASISAKAPPPSS